MRGMLMFAHDNGLFSYGKMAYVSALTATYYINECISLATDKQTWETLITAYPHAEDVFEEPIFIDHTDNNYRHFDLVDGTRTRAKYHNLTRLRAYDLSPYDETLLLDTDLIFQDTSLQRVWGSDSCIRMNHEISDMVKNSPNNNRTIPIGDNSLTSLWATICYFRKSKTAEQFFEVSDYVADNFEYYGTLYGFPIGIVRVDFVMTIAAHIMSGYINEARSVVEPLPTEDTLYAWNRDILINVERGKSTFMSNDGQPFPVSAYRTVHCMNKDSMMDMADRIIECYA